MWYLVVAGERQQKQGYVMHNLHAGMGPKISKVCVNEPSDPDAPFVACGQLWVVERIVPKAIADGRPFWLVDNGYYHTSGYNKYTNKTHKTTGHYELTYKGLAPILMQDPDYSRFPAEQILKPWAPNEKGYVLIAYPGETFGKMVGMNMRVWISTIEQRVRKFTNRRIKLRSKFSDRPIEDDLQGAAVVVTHSSNVAVDAVRNGVPAIVAKTNPAAPVCSTNLNDLDNPPMPDRTQWWASLMSQQFTGREMETGLAWHFMQKIMAQVDGR